MATTEELTEQFHEAMTEGWSRVVYVPGLESECVDCCEVES